MFQRAMSFGVLIMVILLDRTEELQKRGAQPPVNTTTTKPIDRCRLPQKSGPCRAMIHTFFYNAKTEQCEAFTYGGCKGNANRFSTKQECVQACANDVRVTTTKPIDRCQLPQKPGPCRAMIHAFFYNAKTEQCEAFTYGGCKGNANRFSTKQECVQACANDVSVTTTKPIDRCQLPQKSGPCRAMIHAFFYNAKTEQCEAFTYGGCKGNANRFSTKQECFQACANDVSATTTKPIDRCHLPQRPGPCKAMIHAFFYNVKTERCEAFTYGGCEGNANRFSTKQKCVQACANDVSVTTTKPIDRCQLPQKPGPCRAMIHAFFYNAKTGQCEAFTYGGCKGNANRFSTKQECVQACANDVSVTTKKPIDRCQLPQKPGPCRAMIHAFFYNAKTEQCEAFTYGGCKGNANRFSTKQECVQACANDVSVTTTKPIDRCQLPQKPGPCRAMIHAFFYNAKTEQCEAFTYGGCKGNANRFSTKQECVQACANDVSATTTKPIDRCHLPQRRGPCKAMIHAFFYNVKSEQCEAFTYGGCEGNANRFSTKQECVQACANDVSVTTKKPIDRCQLPQKPGPCRAMIHAFFYNAKTGQCEAFTYGGCKGNANRFSTKQECVQACANDVSVTTKKPIDRCQLPQKPGPCRAMIHAFFYNAKTEQCEAFTYGGCKGNANRFSTKQECVQACANDVSVTTTKPIDRCQLPQKPGPCRAMIHAFFYNAKTEQCEAFTYGGCKGNANRFSTKQECVQACANDVSATTTKPIDRCHLPQRRGPCKAMIHAFFYNVKSEQCEAFTYGGCEGNANRFSTKQECVQACANDVSVTTKKPIDRCQLPQKPGPCRAMIHAFFYNAKTEQCEAFTYGGCKGNANRFSTKQECVQACANDVSVTTTKPIDRCQLPQKPGPCRAMIHAFFYNAKTEQCEAFTYGGCKGNANRFSTKQECFQACANDVSATTTKPIDRCHLPQRPGPCKAMIHAFFYNVKSEQCEAFTYGGCEGNANRFSTKQECVQACANDVSVTTKKPIDRCQLPQKPGPCRAMIHAFFYNAKTGQCEAFTYGGCKGNANRFSTKQECVQACANDVSVTTKKPIDRCQLPQKPGPCRAMIHAFFYNAKTEQCEAFTYGGCKGNANRFSTKQECVQACANDVSVTTTKPIDRCQLPQKPGPCRAMIHAFFYNAKTEQCEAFTYGGCKGNANRFSTKQECFQACANDVSATTTKPIDRCHLPQRPGPCKAMIHAFFYNVKSEQCEAFTYGGCEGNANRFSTKQECVQACANDVSVTTKKPIDRCQLPQKPGPCRAMIHAFFYNAKTEQCEAFTYGGCKGNANRFSTKQECVQACANDVSATTTKPIDRCHLPQRPGPCKAMIHAFFYDVKTERCEAFTYGGCEGNVNRFSTKQECVQACANDVSVTTTKPIDRCQLPQKPGPCRAMIHAFFYNAKTGQCEAFTYGGCKGNGNRFSTEDECINACGLCIS